MAKKKTKAKESSGGGAAERPPLQSKPAPPTQAQQPSSKHSPASLRDPAAPSMEHLQYLVTALEAQQFSAITSPSDLHWSLKCLQAKYTQAGKSRWWWIFDDSLAIVARSLAVHSYCVLDGFLGPESAALLRSDVAEAWRAGKLDTKGGLTDGRDGKNTSYTNDGTRGDYIGWFDGVAGEGWTAPPPSTAAGSSSSAFSAAPDAPPDSLPGYLLKVSTLVSELKAHLPADLRDVVSRSRAMVTCYPPGARYARHVDNGKDDGNGNGRRLTVLLYLNVGWREGDGGELAIYGKENKDRVRVVDPVGDRVVVFWSDRRVPHEVLESHKDRFTITTWFFDTPEWEEAKRKGIIPGPSADEAPGSDGDGKAASGAKPALVFVPHGDDAAREPEGKGVLPLERTNEPFIDLRSEAPTVTSAGARPPEPPPSEEMRGLQLAAEPEPALPASAPAPASAPPPSPPSPPPSAAKSLSFTIESKSEEYVIFVPLPEGTSMATTTIDADSSMVKVACVGMEPPDGIVIRFEAEDGDVEKIKAKFSKKKNVGLTITVPKKKGFLS